LDRERRRAEKRGEDFPEPGVSGEAFATSAEPEPEAAQPEPEVAPPELEREVAPPEPEVLPAEPEPELAPPEPEVAPPEPEPEVAPPEPEVLPPEPEPDVAPPEPEVAPPEPEPEVAPPEPEVLPAEPEPGLAPGVAPDPVEPWLADEPSRADLEAPGAHEVPEALQEHSIDGDPPHEEPLQDQVWEDESPALYVGHPAHDEAMAAVDAAEAGQPLPYVATGTPAEIAHEMAPDQVPDPLARTPRARPASAPAAPRSRRGGVITRGIAMLALLAVIAAIVLVVRSGSSSSPTAVKTTPVTKVTIPEGKTRQQAAQIARAKGLTGSYLAASVHSSALNPTAYGAPAGTPNLEGFLFPATYELYAGSSATKLVEEQLAAFKQYFTPNFVARAKALGITPYELIIVASIIEKESATASDGPKIAAVVYNRLREGIPIGIDATLYYAIEQERHITTYTGELTEEDLHLKTPYNTRLNKGLPPTPISNPALAAIHDAAYPANAAYLYYVLAPNGCNNVYLNTQEEFEAADARYNDAVAANGGKPPVCKTR
jgi:cell division protein YceG involved in septum cleavage